MINIYSIDEIIAASEAILTKQIVRKKSILVKGPSLDKFYGKIELPISMEEKKLVEQSIPEEINSIILDEENSNIQKNVDKPKKESDFRNEPILEDLKVTKEELVESMYLTFSKKIRKNTIKLIIDLREEIIFLTKNISSLKENKKIQNNKKKLLTKNIVNLKNTVNELNNNLTQVQINQNVLKEKNKNLNNDHTLLKDSSIKKQEILTLLENKNNDLINVYKNKELETKSKIEKLEEEILDNKKQLHETNDQNNYLINVYKNKELESKSKIEKLEEEILDNKKQLDETNDQNSNLINDYKDKELESKSKIEKLEEEILDNKKQLHETNDQNSNLINDYKDKELESKSKIEKLEEEILDIKKSFEENNKIFNEVNDNNDLVKSQISEINDYKYKIKQLNEKNQNLEKTIEDLRLTMNNNNDVDIGLLESKIKHYQDENVRISSELTESDKRFSVTKESLSALQNQRSDLVEKLNSINNVIKGENLISNVFDNSVKKEKIDISDNKLMQVKNAKLDLSKEVEKIFAKK